jgi:hypothetical protein
VKRTNRENPSTHHHSRSPSAAFVRVWTSTKGDAGFGFHAQAVKAPPPQSPSKVAAAAAAEAAGASEWSSQRSSGGGKSHHPEASAKATAGDADSRAKMWRDWLAQVPPPSSINPKRLPSHLDYQLCTLLH